MDAGWLIGFVIAAAVVVIVVAVVLTIIVLASRIRDQARQAVEHLLRAERDTSALWDLAVTARAAAETVGTIRRLKTDAEQGGHSEAGGTTA